MMDILIADDHKILREGLKALLCRQPDMKVVGEAADGEEAVRMARELRPDIVVMDVTMPVMNGFDATVAIRDVDPSVNVVALSMYANAGFVYEMFRAGASAFLVKDCAFEELEDAVRVVHSGGKYIGDCLKNMLSDMFLISLSGSKQKLMEEELSSREIEVLSLLAEGLTNREAADRLHLSVNTVASHRQNIMRKLALKNTVEMTKYAIRKGYIGL
ncbi:MAG: response regulator transcription factor [Synergistota bacterium]|nr:response regulator transcription factor [Synergistota bacterium]